LKINENQIALEAAIMELTLWVERRGAGAVGDNVRCALATINRNEKIINMTLAVLMTPEYAGVSVGLLYVYGFPLKMQPLKILQVETRHSL
jgi:hypothetical protein